MSALAAHHQAINLSQGFPDFDTDSHLIELVDKYMRAGFNQYAPMTGFHGLRECIAHKYAKQYGVDVDANAEVTITAGGTQGLFDVIAAVVRADDEVIIFEPAYDSYRPAVALFGGKVKAVQLLAPDFSINWDEVAQLITQKTRLIIVNNPSNPTGRIWSAEDILQLERLVKDSGIFVLSDEVYEHIVFDGRQHHTLLKSAVLRSRTFVVCSFGKLLHTTGWKIGYVIAPAALSQEFRKVHQFNVFSVNLPIQMAIAAYLGENTDYYAGLPLFFQKKREYLVQGLTASRFKVLPCEGTYFLLLDYSAISDKSELDFAQQLTHEAGVAMIPVSAFYSDSKNQQLLRICFAKKEDTLQEAITRLKLV